MYYALSSSVLLYKVVTIQIDGFCENKTTERDPSQYFDVCKNITEYSTFESNIQPVYFEWMNMHWIKLLQQYKTDPMFIYIQKRYMGFKVSVSLKLQKYGVYYRNPPSAKIT